MIAASVGGQGDCRAACARDRGQAMLRLFALDHCQLPPKGFLSMRQFARVIAPIVGIVSGLIISLPVVHLDVGDLSRQETGSGPVLSVVGSAGHAQAARRLTNPPSVEKVER